jgi:hypothetical protein
MSAKVIVGEKAWKISRQVPIAVAARAAGDAPPQPPESGIWLHSDKGDALFLPMPYNQLPTEEQLKDVTMTQVAEWMRLAQRRK